MRDAYFIEPATGPGPGVLVIHSWWGLNDGTRAFCDALADEGFSVLAPDLFDGEVPTTLEDAETALATLDINEAASLLLASVNALRALTADPRAPIGAVGFAMGASWALWLSARLPDSVAAVVAYYGTQHIDFDDSQSEYLLHAAALDPIASTDEMAQTEAWLGLAGRPVTSHVYDDVAHNFAEAGAPDYDAEAAALAWERTVDFLRSHPPVTPED
ncbi:MAG: Dienelactone hydrolase [Actinomycetia bacterium]|nr:Dienelactone hydrolase [Actinomycetes bacterium]